MGKVQGAAADDGRGQCTRRDGKPATTTGRGGDGRRLRCTGTHVGPQEPASKLLSPSRVRPCASLTVTSTSMPSRTLWVTVQ